MKTLIIFSCILLSSCLEFNNGSVVLSEKATEIHIQDSLKIEKSIMLYDSLNKIYIDCELRCAMKDNRIRGLRDTLFFQSAQLSNVKKYLNICLKNPTQDKFLKGWIRRAIE